MQGAGDMPNGLTLTVLRAFEDARPTVASPRYAGDAANGSESPQTRTT